MTKYIQLALTLCIALALSACGGSSEPAPKADPTPSAPVESSPAADEGSDAKEAPAEEAAEEAGSDEKAAEPEIDGNVNPEAAEGGDLAASIQGTKWTAGEFTMEFKDDKTVHVNGGPLTMMTAGQGLDAEYTIDGDGKVVITAMGQTREGSWDGTQLEFDGTIAAAAE